MARRRFGAFLDARLAELRRSQVAIMQYHGHIGPSGEDLSPDNPDVISPRERAREDPLAAVGGFDGAYLELDDRWRRVE